jgi:hypothetical protein
LNEPGYRDQLPFNEVNGISVDTSKSEKCTSKDCLGNFVAKFDLQMRKGASVEFMYTPVNNPNAVEKKGRIFVSRMDTVVNLGFQYTHPISDFCHLFASPGNPAEYESTTESGKSKLLSYCSASSSEINGSSLPGNIDFTFRYKSWTEYNLASKYQCGHWTADSLTLRVAQMPVPYGSSGMAVYHVDGATALMGEICIEFDRTICTSVITAEDQTVIAIKNEYFSVTIDSIRTPTRVQEGSVVFWYEMDSLGKPVASKAAWSQSADKGSPSVKGSVGEFRSPCFATKFDMSCGMSSYDFTSELRTEISDPEVVTTTRVLDVMGGEGSNSVLRKISDTTYVLGNFAMISPFKDIELTDIYVKPNRGTMVMDPTPEQDWFLVFLLVVAIAAIIAGSIVIGLEAGASTKRCRVKREVFSPTERATRIYSNLEDINRIFPGSGIQYSQQLTTTQSSIGMGHSFNLSTYETQIAPMTVTSDNYRFVVIDTPGTIGIVEVTECSYIRYGIGSFCRLVVQYTGPTVRLPLSGNLLYMVNSVNVHTGSNVFEIAFRAPGSLSVEPEICVSIDQENIFCAKSKKTTIEDQTGTKDPGYSEGDSNEQGEGEGFPDIISLNKGLMALFIIMMVVGGVEVIAFVLSSPRWFMAIIMLSKTPVISALSQDCPVSGLEIVIICLMPVLIILMLIQMYLSYKMTYREMRVVEETGTDVGHEINRGSSSSTNALYRSGAMLFMMMVMVPVAMTTNITMVQDAGPRPSRVLKLMPIDFNCMPISDNQMVLAKGLICQIGVSDPGVGDWSILRKQGMNETKLIEFKPLENEIVTIIIPESVIGKFERFICGKVKQSLGNLTLRSPDVHGNVDTVIMMSRCTGPQGELSYRNFSRPWSSISMQMFIARALSKKEKIMVLTSKKPSGFKIEFPRYPMDPNQPDASPYSQLSRSCFPNHPECYSVWGDKTFPQTGNVHMELDSATGRGAEDACTSMPCSLYVSFWHTRGKLGSGLGSSTLDRSPCVRLKGGPQETVCCTHGSSNCVDGNQPSCGPDYSSCAAGANVLIGASVISMDVSPEKPMGVFFAKWLDNPDNTDTVRYIFKIMNDDTTAVNYYADGYSYINAIPNQVYVKNFLTIVNGIDISSVYIMSVATDFDGSASYFNYFIYQKPVLSSNDRTGAATITRLMPKDGENIYKSHVFLSMMTPGNLSMPLRLEFEESLRVMIRSQLLRSGSLTILFESDSWYSEQGVSIMTVAHLSTSDRSDLRGTFYGVNYRVVMVKGPPTVVNPEPCPNPISTVTIDNQVTYAQIGKGTLTCTLYQNDPLGKGAASQRYTGFCGENVVMDAYVCDSKTLTVSQQQTRFMQSGYSFSSPMNMYTGTFFVMNDHKEPCSGKPFKDRLGTTISSSCAVMSDNTGGKYTLRKAGEKALVTKGKNSVVQYHESSDVPSEYSMVYYGYNCDSSFSGAVNCLKENARSAYLALILVPSVPMLCILIVLTIYLALRKDRPRRIKRMMYRILADYLTKGEIDPQEWFALTQFKDEQGKMNLMYCVQKGEKISDKVVSEGLRKLNIKEKDYMEFIALKGKEKSLYEKTIGRLTNMMPGKDNVSETDRKVRNGPKQTKPKQVVDNESALLLKMRKRM